MRIPRPLRRAAMVCGALPLLASCSDATGPSGEPRVTEQREVRLAGVTQVLYSAVQGKLYVLQSGEGRLSVVEIDPATGQVERTLRDVLTEEGGDFRTPAAVSADAPYLYLARGAVVRRVALDRMAVDLTVTLEGGDGAGSVVPLPGSPEAFAVLLWRSRVTSSGDVFSFPAGVVVHDGATPRPVRYTAGAPESIVALSGARLLGFDGSRVYDLAVGPNGVAATEVRSGEVNEYGGAWYSAGPYVLSSLGEVLDTRSWTTAARFDGWATPASPWTWRTSAPSTCGTSTTSSAPSACAPCAGSPGTRSRAWPPASGAGAWSWSAPRGWRSSRRTVIILPVSDVR